MENDKPLPPLASHHSAAEFWDTHSLADYWEATEPAEFEVEPSLSSHYLVAVDADLLDPLHRQAARRGIGTESLGNLFLEQHLAETLQSKP